MNNNFKYPEGSTPLTNDEFHELIPRHVTSQGELNAVEQMNIAKGLLWLEKKEWKYTEILNENFIRKLHKKMFGDVWKWAGNFRKTDKNIGVYWIEIPVALKKLIDDTKFQIEHKSYKVDEIAVRFHHRLVHIHLFANGNGRHSRIITDQLLKSLEINPFIWGGYDIQDYSRQTAVRKRYIESLRNADKGLISPLMEFVRN